PAPPGRAPSGPLRPRYEPPQEEAELFSRALEAAIELSIDPAAAPNETRFSNAPPSASLALSAAEVSLRPAATSDPAQDAQQPTADVLSSLPLFPLFAEVPPEVLSEMITGTELIELGDGEYVMRKGDAGDALYGIVDGSVVIEVPGQPIEHALAEGDVFGESCLLQDEPRHADVRVKGRLTALRIPRDTLLQMLRGHPPLAELLLELLTRRLLGNLLQSSPLFQEFDSEGRRALSRMFEVRRAAAGTRLAIAGKRMDGLYISLTGTLLVEAPGAEAAIASPGSMFGQHTLLSQEPAPASITARVNLVVLRLPSATFTQLVMQHPMIMARLAELSTDAVVSVTL
ncbi:MAG TPA: cyclic nucleotide-binding domain-containing protein, partial [Polyangiales bacterium]|nr:cyclic nucleotide-binding domain-containing protein [Polyangiales bacterium]